MSEDEPFYTAASGKPQHSSFYCTATHNTDTIQLQKNAM